MSDSGATSPSTTTAHVAPPPSTTTAHAPQPHESSPPAGPKREKPFHSLFAGAAAGALEAYVLADGLRARSRVPVTKLRYVSHGIRQNS